MRTMTTLAAALTSPRCPTTINSIYTAPTSLKESAAAKYSIRCNTNSSSTSLQGLREFPTRIPPKTPTAAIVSPYVDDDDRTPPQPHPDLSSTVKERNNTPLLSLPSAIDESFDYKSELVRINAIIEQMKQRGQLTPSTDQYAIVGPHADDDDCTPPQPHPDLSSTGEERNSLPLLSLSSAVDESFGYQSELV